MPHVRKSVSDMVKRWDSKLDLRFDKRRERWVLLRASDVAGQFHEVCVLTDDLGGYKEPDERLAEWLATHDMARARGYSHEDKVRNFIRDKNKRNEELKENAWRAQMSDEYARFEDHARTATRSRYVTRGYQYTV